MREVIIAREVYDKIADLRSYLTIELKLSEEAAMSRMDRMGDFLEALVIRGIILYVASKNGVRSGIVVRCLRDNGYLPMKL